MKSAVFALLYSSVIAKRYVDPSTPCRRTSQAPKPDHVVTPLTPVADLPETHIWSNVDGVNYLTNMRNQHIPSYCESCRADAATSAMSDRIKIVRKTTWPDINIAPQVLNPALEMMAAYMEKLSTPSSG